MSSKPKIVEFKVDYKGCWICTSHATNGRGYFYFSINKIRLRGHRWFYILYKGPIPEGHEVRHTCDTSTCINPDHLITGTHQDNMNDMKERRRVRHGEASPKAKLNRDIVKSIRDDKTSQHTELAKKYNVHESTISAIRLHKIWKHVA